MNFDRLKDIYQYLEANPKVGSIIFKGYKFDALGNNTTEDSTFISIDGPEDAIILVSNRGILYDTAEFEFLVWTSPQYSFQRAIIVPLLEFILTFDADEEDADWVFDECENFFKLYDWVMDWAHGFYVVKDPEYIQIHDYLKNSPLMGHDIIYSYLHKINIER